VCVIVVMATVDSGSRRTFSVPYKKVGACGFTLCDGASTQFGARDFMYIGPKWNRQRAEAASQNITSALPNNNFVIAHADISISARILCQVISLGHKSLCFY
jgi:hypothetical protein